MIANFIDHESRRLGSWVNDVEESGAGFRVWAPLADKVDLVLNGRSVAMEKRDRGYFETRVSDGKAGDRYTFRLNDGKEVPDPASRYQPEGPHGASQIVERDFAWQDSQWKGLALEELVIYELHIGTFTAAGGFTAVIERLPHLQAIGVNAIEIMPVAQFAGKRNWGYDGVGLFAPQNSYGTAEERSPTALKKLVQACHQAGIAVLLDVVYNHLGPEGNYLPQFGPYFQSKYKTPWGDALNYDGEWSDEVRRYFLENARQWLEEYHFDGLRLDAVHAIFDASARPFLEELSSMKRALQEKLGRNLHLIAESDANDSRILRPSTEGGLGLDGQWADDLHHTIHAALTGEKHGYYSDYGDIRQFGEAYQRGVVFHGDYSDFRHRTFGRSYQGIDRTRLVVCSQNHDQIGNRMKGDRLISLVGESKAKLAAALVFLTSNLPLMFMGEELGETAPFLYFVDHTDKELLEAVRKGRREEFSGFAWQGEAPDPASAETFEKSKINWERASELRARTFAAYYRRLIALSKWIRREKLLEEGHVRTQLLAEGRVLSVLGERSGRQIQIFFSFSDAIARVNPESSSGELELILNSADSDSDVKSNDRTEASAKAQIEGSPFKGVLDLQPYSATVLRNRK